MTSALAALVLAALAWGPASADKNLRYPPEQAPEPPPMEDAGDAIVHNWVRGLEGRQYYLRSPRHPLLANDAVAIKRAKIRYFYPYDDGHSRRRYRVTLWFENVEPAPPETFRLEVEIIETLDELDKWLATEFSPVPLESAFAWPPAIQRMVRMRYIAEGMDRPMVELILGGLEYRVVRETLDDGRLREVWLLKKSRQGRRAFTARRSLRQAPVSDTADQAPGFYLFGSGDPEDLSIAFIDGHVARQQP
jgi:hypothetical protein